MKKFFPLLLMTVLSGIAAQAQNQVGYRSPNPGIMNPSYEMAIEPQFDNVALDFSEGMACVMIQRGQMHTYINTNGKPAFDKQFRNPRPFVNSVAAVENDEHKWGFMNVDGKIIIPMEYGDVSNFSEGFAVVSVDVTGGGHYRMSYIDLNGKLMGVPRFFSANPLSESYAAIKLKDGNWQVLNRYFTATSGLLPYEGVGEFHEGLARVRIGERYGFIDTTGKLVIAMSDDWCSERFSEGLCLIKRGGKFGYMDMQGRTVIPCQFTYAEDFSCSRAIASKSQPDENSGMITSRGIINHDGEWVVEEGKFDWIETFSEDLAVVSLDGKYGYANVNGRVVIEMKYDKARAFHEGYAAVRVDRKWGFLKLTNVDEKMKLIGY